MTTGEIFTALAYVGGAVVFFVAARQRRLATEGMKLVALWGVVGGVFGARIAAWLSTPGADAAALAAPGGRALIGGLLGGWLFVEIAKKRLGIRRSTGDLWALALPAGETIGRIGCYFNGCCYGTRCDAARVPWAIYQHGAWRHPAQLYASLIAATIFVVLWNLRAKMRREGDLFRLYLLLFAVGRFVLEFFRESSALVGPLSLAQLICLEIAASALIWNWISRRKNRATQLGTST